MNLRDFAVEIEPGATAGRRHEIEQKAHRFLWQYLTELAAEVDDDAMNYRINYAHEVARMLRDKAHEHFNQT